ncbi:MAG: hypothetical protein AAFZ15_19075 [Bacteroidota bacterium]
MNRLKIVGIILLFSISATGQNVWITTDNPVYEIKPNTFIEFNYDGTNSRIKLVNKELEKEHLLFDNSLVRGLSPVRRIEQCILTDSLLGMVCLKSDYVVQYWLFKHDKEQDKYLLANAEIVYEYVGVRPTTGPRKSFFISYNLISVNTMERFSEDPDRKDVLVQYDTDWGKTTFERKESVRRAPVIRK